MESGECRVDVIELNEFADFYGKALSYFVPKSAHSPTGPGTRANK
jgi:hypothetical protein